MRSALLRRALAALVLTALAAAGLTACDSKVGLAAKVTGAAGTSRLTDSQLAAYVRTGAKPYTDQSSNTTVVPKLFALEAWVTNRLFRDAVAKRGGLATAAQIRSARAGVLGTTTADQVHQIYARQGYTAKLADLIIESNEWVVILVQRIAPGLSVQDVINALQQQDAGQRVLSVVKSAKSTVAVSRRYGTWDTARVALTTDAGAGLPGFVRYSGGTTTDLLPSTAP